MRSALVNTYARLPIALVEGAGMKVRDADGRAYWDFYGGHAVTLLGHAHPAVTRAIETQARRLTFYSNLVPLEVRDEAARRLCALAPPGLDHVFYCNSGSEANENALKLAIQQTRRGRITALTGGFHGRTLLALSATHGDALRAPFAEMLCAHQHIRPNAPDAVARIDERDAAVIVEPIQGIAGVVELSAGFLAALRRRCTDVGAMLVFDEVQTGMGRLGVPFASGSCGVTPDMMTLAKSIANGVPMGAVVMSGGVADRVATGDLGSTFGGGPVACAAQVAVVETLTRQRLIERASELGARMRERLRVGPVRRVRGRGCLIGLELNVPARPVVGALLDRGFITGTSHDPNVVRLMPPLIAPFEAVDELAEALADLGGT